ncbi:MAG TPA: ATP-binding protein [Verrucomicrobiae bacterium]|jgi:signal transduction histidine kinase|nr:ATP-binding protein [Verrucomicrobiae bacterium]
MKSKLARFYPSSLGLAARIGFILIGAVVLSIGISTAFIFIVGEGRNHMPVIPAETLAEKILAVYRRIDATPAGARDAASLQAEAPILRIDWPATSHQLARTPPAGYLRDLRTFLLLGLHNPTRGVAVGVSFPPGFGEGPPPGEPPEGQPAEGQPSGPPPGPPPSDSGPAGELIQGAVVQGGFARNRFAVIGPPIRVSMELGDGSWLSLEASEWRTLPFPLIDFLVRVVPISTVCLLLSLWVIRGFMRPITRLAAAADRLGIDGDVSMLQETGAPEMRAAARAFNEMQLRLRRLIDDRTQMLAAISHDLKTPITRLRLRAEFIEEPALQEKMLADLAEMEAIVASTLAFARSDARSEGSEAVDLADMLQSLAESRADSGAAVGYQGPAHLTIRARPVALRRALSNLIDNAIKYGTSAQIALRLEERQAVVEIADEGPGIAAEQMELVFRPYYRLEGSRSRETGGVGLGLSIARAVILAEGGEIALANRPEGGLCARVTLPLPTAAPA